MRKVLLVGMSAFMTLAIMLSPAAGAQVSGPELLSPRQAPEPSGKLEPLPPAPAPPEARVKLGLALFFDPRLSGDATVSCATCHIPEKAWADGQALAAGYPGTLNFRNTPTVLNATFSPRLYWDGRFARSDYQSLVRDHLTEAHFMNMDGRLIPERLIQVPEYQGLFQEAFGGEPSFGRILAALEAFSQTLTAPNSPLDRHLQGEAAFSDPAGRGLDLFSGKAGCIRCHSGPLLSDGKFHNLGAPQNPEVFQEPLRHITFRRFFRTLGVEGYHRLREDVGLYALTKEEQDRGKFRTPSLREVARTAPYLHNGMLKTLDEVVDFYDRGGGTAATKDPLLKPLGLTAQEKRDLVAFLEGLSGDVPSVLPPQPSEYQLQKLGAAR